jgi:hydrogenase maturation factor
MAPGRVVAISGSTAEVQIEGRHRTISTLAVPELGVDDWVIVVGGSAFHRLEPADGLRMQELLAGAGPASS